MVDFHRRKFLEGLALSGAVVTTVGHTSFMDSTQNAPLEASGLHETAIDFRYAPRLSQATICFPDDSKKSLVGQCGDLRYGFQQGPSGGLEDFAAVVMFSLAGMQDDHIVRQWLEAPHIPIVHTLIERSTATLELTAFATRDADEGRVDNVLMTILPKGEPVSANPRLHLRSCVPLKLTPNEYAIVVADPKTNVPFLVAAKVGSADNSAGWWDEEGYSLFLPHGAAARNEPLRYVIRFPQEGQSAEAVQGLLKQPDTLLEEAREYWRQWKAFGSVSWGYAGRSGEFLTACARNIQQAREVKNGRLVFQVGPTVYRNLWIVDGNFLLEAARYLGYDKEADDGLLSEWTKQLPSGQVVAGGGGEHWKDTAIAMFTLVRQCELKQDWQFFKDLEPNLRRALDFLFQLREKARIGTSINGRYGLLAPGFADGGIGGVRSEFTNTVWALAGLKAVAEAAERQRVHSLRDVRAFYDELRAAFLKAARAEMVGHSLGFEYLPMLPHEDPTWHDADPWNRPRPQSAQWALSHAIFPGIVFAKDDPIVRGHIALMQSCTEEDVPAETGWLWHESVWNYNASFVAQVYLWAGLPEWADRTFRGFLNHASPLYCWREEQPLQHALVGQDWGDMPHNWASAECIRYLRHMMVLEDGLRLRLLEGMVPSSLREQQAFRLERTPTRFGRVTVILEPLDNHGGWKLDAQREPGQHPGSVELPASLAGRRFDRLLGAEHRTQEQKVMVDPAATKWTAVWR